MVDQTIHLIASNKRERKRTPTFRFKESSLPLTGKLPTMAYFLMVPPLPNSTKQWIKPLTPEPLGNVPNSNYGKDHLNLKGEDDIMVAFSCRYRKGRISNKINDMNQRRKIYTTYKHW
jgi:hypothetical protein